MHTVHLSLPDQLQSLLLVKTNSTLEHQMFNEYVNHTKGLMHHRHSFQQST